MKITNRQLRRIIKEEVSRAVREGMAPPKADLELVAEFEGLVLYNNITGAKVDLTQAANWDPADEGVDTDYYRRIADAIDAEASNHGITELWNGEEQEIQSIDQVVTGLYQVASDNEDYNSRYTDNSTSVDAFLDAVPGAEKV